MGRELERLRHRLYAAGAEAADVTAYRVALAAEPPAPIAPPSATPFPPRRFRRPRLPALAAALSAAVAIAAVGIATAAAEVAPGPAGSPSAEVRVRSAVRLTSSPQGLTSRVDVQRLIDRVFADRAGAEDLLDDRIRSTALPDASTRTVLASAGGRSDDGRAVTPVGTRGLTVGTGDVLLLSVATREPASSTWQVLGWREGEPHVPHPVVEVLPQVGGADRLAVAVVRVPEAMTVTSLDVQVTPDTPFAHRMELHDVAVCAPVTGPACVSGWRGTRD